MRTGRPKQALVLTEEERDRPVPFFLRQYQRFFGSSSPHLRLLYFRRTTAVFSLQTSGTGD
jgi:hypothetical protein